MESFQSVLARLVAKAPSVDTLCGRFWGEFMPKPGWRARVSAPEHIKTLQDDLDDRLGDIASFVTDVVHLTAWREAVTSEPGWVLNGGEIVVYEVACYQRVEMAAERLRQEARQQIIAAAAMREMRRYARAAGLLKRALADSRTVIGRCRTTREPERQRLGARRGEDAAEAT